MIVNRNISNFRQFFRQIFASFIPAVGFLWPLFCLKSWNPDIISLGKQKYVEILNNIWILTFYIGILAIFGNFWVNFCLIYSSCWFFDHFFCLKSWNPNMLSFWNTKYVEILDNIWIITFYTGILAIFGNFWANFCLVHSNR